MNRADVTELLDRVNRGEAEAFTSLVSAVYTDLRRMAASLMRGQAGQTLQPTALVHEAWLNLAARDQQWDSRAHFFGAAARAMRQILVAHARQRAAQKRAGHCVRVTFRELDIQANEPDIDLFSLDEALTALMREDERLGRVMELRYFAGLTLSEIAEVSGVSLATVKRDWVYARAWLYERMNAGAASRAVASPS